jgi:glyoxylate/hydroxypyruvate reductase A
VTRRTVDVLLQIPGRAVEAWRVALAAALPEAMIEVWPDASADPDYALVWRPPAELFSRVRPAKAIFNLGAGVDTLLAVPTLPRDVPILRLEDAGMAEQMAEYVTLAVLRAYREADVYAAQQRAAHWRPRERRAKAEFGVGLLGCGVLGRSIAAALAPFGFPLAGWSRTGKALPGVAVLGTDNFTSFLAASRALVCTLPLTPQTTGLLDRAALAQLPRGAHVINVARGEIVVDADLLGLLDEGHLSGATLDVFRTEPLPPEHAFWHHPRITVTPHVSAVTLITESVAQVAAKIGRIERGDTVTGIVDRDRGY